MQIGVITGPAKRSLTTNATAAYAALLATATRPALAATRCIMDFLGTERQHGEGRTTLRIKPFGIGSNNETVKTKVIGWDLTPSGLFVPQTVCEVAGTMSSTLIGIAGQDVIATEYFCDILSLTSGVALLVQGTADIDTAFFECNVTGFPIIEIKYSPGTGTSANGLYTFSG